MVAEVKLLGFAPDLDPATQGVIRDGVRFIPTVNGFSPMRKPTLTGLPQLEAQCRGAFVSFQSDGTKRIFAGTQTELFEATGGNTWTNVSAATYTGSSDSRWRFAQYGDTTYAVNRIDNMQYSASGDFAARAGAPKALIVEVVEPGFVMAFNYNDGSNDYVDGWYCSALNDDTDWTPSIATQCANGRLTSTYGAITAAKALGDSVVVYKDRSMYVGTYIGSPLIFQWRLLPGKIGAPCQEAVVSIDTAHIFAGYDNFYYFDGTRATPIGNPLKEWYNVNVDRNYRNKMLNLHDTDNSLVYFWYAESDGTISNALVYNYKADKWGKASLYSGKSLEAALEYQSGTVYTYDNLGSFYNTYDDLPSISYDSSFWTTSTPQVAIIQNDHYLYSLVEAPDNDVEAESYITCCFTGSDDIYTMTNRFRIRYVSDDTYNAEMTLDTCTYIGGDVTTSSAYMVENNKIDAQITAKWHSPTFTFRGDYEITGYTIDLIQEGSD